MAKKTKKTTTDKSGGGLQATVVRTYTVTTTAHLIALGLKRERLARKMSQKEFAELLGVATFGSIAAYEGGRTLPKAESLVDWMREHQGLREFIMQTDLPQTVTIEE